MKIVSEEYTSQMCGKCGYLSNEYNKREKVYPYCKHIINHEINGARNILLKNQNLIINKKGVIPEDPAKKSKEVDRL